MTNTELSKSYWRYYLMLEKRLLEMADIGKNKKIN